MSVALAPDPADPDGPPAITLEVARLIASDMEAEPGGPSDCGPLLASLVRNKFGITTLLRLLVANVPPELRNDGLWLLVRNALTALATGEVAALDHVLGQMRRYLAGHLNGFAAAALDALDLTSGAAGGHQPPWF